MPSVPIIRTDSILDKLEQMHERIARRAYQLSEGREGLSGDPFRDWLTAEREVVWKPAVELRERDGTFRVSAAMPGVDAKDIEVDITPDEVVITAATEHTHAVDTGQVHQCEFSAGELFRSLRFPKAVDATKAKAEYHDGMLDITAPIADGHRARVEVTAG